MIKSMSNMSKMVILLSAILFVLIAQLVMQFTMKNITTAQYNAILSTVSAKRYADNCMYDNFIYEDDTDLGLINE